MALLTAQLNAEVTVMVTECSVGDLVPLQLCPMVTECSVRDLVPLQLCPAITVLVDWA